MKCPNCGAKMSEGSLYCEKCGKDIHIVPDFEPELEQSMEQTIHNILEDLHEDMMKGEEEKEQQVKKVRRKPVRRKSHFLEVLMVLGALLILALGGIAWLAYGYLSEEYQISKAVQYVEAGKYDKAILCYNRALELDSGNIELVFSLAEVYYLKNNKIEYEYLLREIVKSGSASTEQLERAYDKLIAIYRAREDYQTINDLLLSSGNETLLSTYQNYLAREPEFSINEGYYTSIQPLKLTAFGTGKIYYTMDESEPTEESAQYTAPIILENGDYVIRAYFVNDKGISSDIVSKEYHIENDEILAPEISALSGEYNFPVNIEVTSGGEDVYYTTDGTDPTYFSTAYTGPIPMPLGKSIFKFARIVDGVTGTIAERNYQLIMNTDYTPEQAVAAVVEYSMLTGKIYDISGHFDDSGDSYQYEYQYVTNINKVDDFYVIAEIFRGADGTLAKTGTNFAVNAYTGERFKLQQEGRGALTLIEIEQELREIEANSDEEE